MNPWSGLIPAVSPGCDSETAATTTRREYGDASADQRDTSPFRPFLMIPVGQVRNQCPRRAHPMLTFAAARTAFISPFFVVMTLVGTRHNGEGNGRGDDQEIADRRGDDRGSVRATPGILAAFSKSSGSAVRT